VLYWLSANDITKPPCNRRIQDFEAKDLTGFKSAKSASLRLILSAPTGRLKYVDELGGLGRGNPWVGGTIGIAIISMAGIPPLAGFFAKMYLFFAAMEASMYIVAVIGVLTSVISAFYYLRWVKIMYFEERKEVVGLEIDRVTSWIMGMMVWFMVSFIANPGPVKMLAHQMAQCLNLFLCKIKEI
jgi:NADH:ubiquinone oxidoreductase subunit 2 (subunit N)